MKESTFAEEIASFFCSVKLESLIKSKDVIVNPGAQSCFNVNQPHFPSLASFKILQNNLHLSYLHVLFWVFFSRKEQMKVAGVQKGL